MSVIAVTACLKRCSIAVLKDDGAIAEINENVDAATNLVGLTSDLVRDANISWNSVKQVVTTSGPGSFTGIRTAQSMVQALAFSLSCEAVAMSYFDIILSIASQTNPDIDVSNTLVLIQNEKDHFYYSYGNETGVVKPMHINELMFSKLSPIPHFIICESDVISKDYSLGTVQYIHNTYDFRRASNFIHYYDPKIAKAVKPLYINAAC